MKILVLGAGGIGGYFGGRLVQAGADVTFLVRENRCNQLREHGLRIESQYGDAVLEVDAKLQAQIEPRYDLILLTCKAYDLASAMEAIRPALSPSAAILPLLNGIAHMDALGERFGRERILGGTAKIQVTLTPAHIIRQLNDWQTITFGEQDGSESARVLRLKALLDKTGVEVKLSRNIMRDLWLKLVHLSTVAGMTCLMRANLGEIVRTPDGSALLKTFFDANARIASCAGHTPDDAFVRSYHDLFEQRDSRYEASMLRDLEKGGPIEAEHVLGFMLGKCREAGLDDTLHRVAYTHVKAYEQRRDAHRLPQRV
ncbi:MAG: ketopantoate reductase family protein [Burkholderiales bacterium]|nr:ketopantoate reductase family protein [Burkholderiales bacterium]